jgi:hypothetical protein
MKGMNMDTKTIEQLEAAFNEEFKLVENDLGALEQLIRENAIIRPRTAPKNSRPPIKRLHGQSALMRMWWVDATYPTPKQRHTYSFRLDKTQASVLSLPVLSNRLGSL